MAINFAGGSDRLNYTGLGTFLAGTLHLRFKTSLSPATGMVLAARWDSGSRNGFALHVNTSNKLELLCYPGTASPHVQIASTTTANDGNWHSAVALVRSGSGNNNAVYMDGALEASVNSTGIFGMNDALNLSWGNIGFWTPFNGDMCDVAWWDSIHLDADEIAALGKGFSAKHMRRESLEFYAPLVRATDDRSGGRVASSFGSPSVTPHARVMGSMV